jgi:hypothetical protein
MPDRRVNPNVGLLHGEVHGTSLATTACARHEATPVPAPSASQQVGQRYRLAHVGITAPWVEGRLPPAVGNWQSRHACGAGAPRTAAGSATGAGRNTLGSRAASSKSCPMNPVTPSSNPGTEPDRRLPVAAWLDHHQSEGSGQSMGKRRHSARGLYSSPSTISPAYSTSGSERAL